MTYEIRFHKDFEEEFMQFEHSVQVAIVASIKIVKVMGFNLARPQCDTLKSAKFKNLKELRITIPSGEWRIAFAFDPERKAILLTGASKSGISQKLFYTRLIKLAEKRFEEHLKGLK